MFIGAGRKQNYLQPHAVGLPLAVCWSSSASTPSSISWIRGPSVLNNSERSTFSIPIAFWMTEVEFLKDQSFQTFRLRQPRRLRVEAASG